MSLWPPWCTVRLTTPASADVLKHRATRWTLIVGGIRLKQTKTQNVAEETALGLSARSLIKINAGRTRETIHGTTATLRLTSACSHNLAFSCGTTFTFNFANPSITASASRSMRATSSSHVGLSLINPMLMPAVQIP